MSHRRDIGVRVRQQLRELGSLASAIGIVLLVLAFSVISIGAGGVVRQQQASTQTGEEPITEARVAELFLGAEGIEGPPLVYRAKLTVKGWKDRQRRVVEASVLEAEPVAAQGDRNASAQRAVAQMAERLVSQPVLASVAPRAASVLPASGPARVSLVVTPRGGTVTLLIDDVLGEDGAPLTPAAAAAGAATTTAVAAATDAAGTAGTAVVSKMTASSLSRYYGRPGTKVTLFGTGFGRPGASKWITAGGVKATWSAWSDTAITFVVPSAMRAPGYVGVVSGKTVSNGLYYTPYTPGIVTSISPREGAPGSVVTMKGTGFGASQGGGWVTFAGHSAQIVTWSDTSIQVIVPKGAEAGYVGVVIYGLASNGLLYGPHGMPLVQSVSTGSVFAGQQVTINGRDFGNRPGRVVFGGKATIADEWTPTRVTFTVAENAAPGYLGVQRADGPTSNGLWRYVVPRMDSLSRWWAEPGDVIELRGKGFGDSQGARRVYIAGASAPALTWSDTRITAEVPEASASGYVGVGTPAACSRGKYLLVERRAHIDSVEPRALREGDQFTIQGTGFGPALPTSRVQIGGVFNCITISWSDEEIVAVVPPGATDGYVGVNKRGVSSNGVWVQVLP